MRKLILTVAATIVSTSVLASGLDFQMKEWEVGAYAGMGSLNTEEKADATGFTLSGGKNFQIMGNLRTTSQLHFTSQSLNVEDGEGSSAEFGASQRISYMVAEVGGIAIRPFGEVGYARGNANINISKKNSLDNNLNNNTYNNGYNNNYNNGYNGYNYLGTSTNNTTRKIDHSLEYNKFIMAVGTEVDFGNGLVAIAKYDFSSGNYNGSTEDNKQVYTNLGTVTDNDRDNEGDLDSGLFTLGLAYLF